MIDAMINEIKLAKVSFGNKNSHPIETIYFGGGTPSLLHIDDTKKLLEALNQNFSVSKVAEITLEANPDDISEMKLAEWQTTGINRFSIGVQSFKEQDLVWMNRAHNAQQAFRCIQLVKEAGFKNYSVDLIYGTPTLSDDDWKSNVQAIIDLQVPHMSCYGLTVENHTALHRMISLRKREEVDGEKSAYQFLLLMDWLNEAGYEHYEISNFAKPGYRSKHNSSYWQGKPYIGIGPSAHSFDGNSRKWNVSNNALYIQSLQQGIIPYQQETLTDVQKLNEYIMTSLRTIEGIDLEVVNKKFGKFACHTLQVSSKKHVDSRKLQPVQHKLVLTKQGKLFADGIAADMFFEENARASFL